jgi:hypothetical protein
VRKHILNTLAVAVCLGGLSLTADPREATLVYDVAVREYVCWREGALTPEARTRWCDSSQGWHPVTGNLYFVRGQAVTVLLVNGLVGDIFTLEIKAEDLPEPTVAIAGEIKELPKLAPIPPPPVLVAGPGATFIAGVAEIRGILMRLLGTAEEKDVRAWLKEVWIDPANAKELLDLLAIDVAGAITTARAVSPGFADEASQLTGHLIDAQGNVTRPTNISQLIGEVRRLSSILETQRGLRERIVVSGLPALGKLVSDAAKLARSPGVARASSVNASDLQVFMSDFENAFPAGERWARIDSVVVEGEVFSSAWKPVDPALTGFLAELTKSASGKVPSTAQDKVRKNLRALAELWPDIQRSFERYRDLNNLKPTLEAYPDEAGSLYQLQRNLEALGRATVLQATALNVAARTLPLVEPYDLLPVGVWFASREITLTLKQGQRIALFDLGGVSDTSRISTVGGDTAAAKPVLGSVAAETTARVFRFRVYNLYHLQLGLGFVYSGTRDDRFQVVSVTTGSGATATTQKFFEQTRSRSYNLLATADVIIFPFARHRFPFRPRYADEKPPPRWHDFGALLGFSLTSPNRDFLLGSVFFPRQSAVGIKFGWHIALRDYPPEDFDVEQPITEPTTALSQTRKDGLFVGLSFTTDFFVRVFAPIFKP